jgi:hypothetical protein
MTLTLTLGFRVLEAMASRRGIKYDPAHKNTAEASSYSFCYGTNLQAFMFLIRELY